MWLQDVLRDGDFSNLARVQPFALTNTQRQPHQDTRLRGKIIELQKCGQFAHLLELLVLSLPFVEIRGQGLHMICGRQQNSVVSMGGGRALGEFLREAVDEPRSAENINRDVP